MIDFTGKNKAKTEDTFMTVLVLYDVFTPQRRQKAQIITSAIRVRGMIHKDAWR